MNLFAEKKKQTTNPLCSFLSSPKVQEEVG